MCLKQSGNNQIYKDQSEDSHGSSVYAHGYEVPFDGELSNEWHENKAKAVRELSINNYDDPFFNDGNLCTQAWKDLKFDEAIAHNRACLLKERDILIARNLRKPDD